MGSPKRLLGITHVKARRNQKELDIRLAFDDRPPIEAIVSFDAVGRMAQMFGQLASAVRAQYGDDIKVEYDHQWSVHRAPLQEFIIIRFTSFDAEVYTFAVPPIIASRIATRLQEDSSKPRNG